MADPHDAVGVAKPRGWFWWLQGRAGRREYWLYVGLMIVAGVVLSHAPPAMSIVFSLILMCVQARRLHDLGRSGWWVFVLAAAPVVAGAPLYFLAGEDAAEVAGAVIEVALVVALGAFAGEAGGNRFGPPPTFTVRRVLTGR